MITNNIGLKQLGNDECVLEGSITQNNIPVLEQNYIEKMNANNGFSGQRLFRKIASIPELANIKAAQDGYNLDDVNDLRRFLADNPEYMSVKAINTQSDPHIIIR